MQLDKDTLRKLRGLIIFTLVILVGLWLCTPFFCLYRYAYAIAFTVPFMVCEAAVSSQLLPGEKSQ